MNNGQMPPVQQAYPQNGMPMIQQVPVEYHKNSGAGKVILIIVLALVSITFAGLFGWVFMQYTDLKNNFDSKLEVDLAEAVDEQTAKLEMEFSEREKDPYLTFSGPSDYGQLTFEYPKTWSVYIAADAANGGDFSAFFNPIQVETVSANTINALRLVIVDKSFDSVVSDYQKYLNKTLEMTTISLNGFTANRYVGTLPSAKDLQGIIVIFKIRDKTAILRTDSMLFEGDFDRLINTITFNA